jgi:outer membrane protein assembly factor BamE (lipoprotein component of BamABCDE complex)
MKSKLLWIISLGFILSSLSACMTHPTNAGPDATNLTVGKVQGEIKEGMPASDVAAILGSPNIVTTDEKRREVWIYDKVSSNRVDTRKSFG